MRGNRRRQSFQGFNQQNYLPASFNFRQENLMQREYAHSQKICNYCNIYHYSQSDKCYFICLYCHSIHFKKNLPGSNKFDKITICPILKDNALQQQNKKAFVCEACEGNGSYQKVIQTNYLELKLVFQKRKAQYQKSREKGQTQPKVLERKTFRNHQQSKSEICESCHGKGKILKMTYCCQNGCPECAFSKIKVNPKWREIRSKGQDNDEIFPCRICSKEVEVGEKIFKLNCGHTFHWSCIFSWLHVKEGCYTCSQVDPYLEKNEFPREQLDKLNLIESMLKDTCQKKQKVTQRKQKQKYSNKIRNDLEIQEYLKLQKLKKDVMINQSSLSSELNSSWMKSKSQFQQSVNQSHLNRTKSQRQVTEHQNSDEDSLIIVKVPSQSEQRGLSLDLSIIQMKQLQEINQHMAEKVENQIIDNLFQQKLSYKNKREQNIQLIYEKSSIAEQI